jgi:ATP-binding cassette subfamily F protein 3
VLVLDEPGNHLDVETVEALADALQQYKGTVIFTSHDRHFMHRVATSVIEVRDGSVKNYFGNYDSYLESVEKEIDEGERERAGQARRKAGQSNGKQSSGGSPPASKAIDYRQSRRDQRKAEKELQNLERKIARLDDEKRELNEKMLSETDPDEALRLHEAIEEINRELTGSEERWIELSEDV